MQRSNHVVALLVLVLLVPSIVFAGLTKPDRKSIRQKLEGTLYMKVDAPCIIGRHPFGVYYSPLVEVSPRGVNTDEGEGFSAGWYHLQSAYWGIKVNDPVEFDDVEFEGDTFEVELEGVREAADESTVVKFSGINSYDDFQAAFEHVFSTQHLQYLHDDWSEEIKTAISDRHLMAGMTKRQVYYVTGAPESFERSRQDGKDVETWTLRQRKGMKMGFFGAHADFGGGPPKTLRFEDGALVNVVGEGTGGLDLDD